MQEFVYCLLFLFILDDHIILQIHWMSIYSSSFLLRNIILFSIYKFLSIFHHLCHLDDFIWHGEKDLRMSSSDPIKKILLLHILSSFSSQQVSSTRIRKKWEGNSVKLMLSFTYLNNVILIRVYSVISWLTSL